MKKLLITGASGFVGCRVVARWRNEYKILAPTHAELDITDRASVDSYFLQHTPDVVVHLAALSNTGYCEQNPDDSYLVNVEGAANIARAAALCRARLIFFSSDQVYNGNVESGLLNEDVRVAPENVYGRHKLEAEERVLYFNPNTVVLRATWMYDIRREGMPTHNNFVLNIEEAMRQHTSLLMATREYRGITWVDEVVSNIPHTWKLPGGVYNFGAENTRNTYDTARAYLDIVGCTMPDIVVPDHERFAAHVRNISISMHKATEASGGAIRFLDTVEGLRRFVSSQRLV